MATGNHFVFDVAAGIAVTVLGYGVAWLAARPSRARLEPAPAAV
jgi:hypothetical protein